MQVLRTPDERFANIPDYPFAPNYAMVPDGEGGELRVHYLDEGPRDGQVVVLLHGEPSWSFLYRKMIPPLVAAGFRCIVPDLVGFGKSDKPAAKSDYTYARHVAWMKALLIDTMDIRGATLFGQDWGGLVGIRVLAENSDRFKRLVVANTGLPTGEGKPTEAFLRWQQFSQTAPAFFIGRIVSNGCAEPMPPEVVDAYDAPFPDDSYKEGARIFPSLVPTTPDDPAAGANRKAWESLHAWDGKVLCAFSDKDAITAGGFRPFMQLPGAQGQQHVTTEGGGHFLQEDRGPELAQTIIRFIEANP
ncbi:MAG TPA: haloalkane dehalogenase [Tepidiformaceae bacterium]|nr:haloalkane dehalogenase [Tepidiformaceae bacterium]